MIHNDPQNQVGDYY